MQRVKGVEESFLSLVFTGQELDVIHQQNVYISVLGLEFSGLVVLDRIDEVVREFFAGNISHLGSRLQVNCVVTNGVK
jgi:hypothetical protein